MGDAELLERPCLRQAASHDALDGHDLALLEPPGLAEPLSVHSQVFGVLGDSHYLG